VDRWIKDYLNTSSPAGEGGGGGGGVGGGGGDVIDNPCMLRGKLIPLGLILQYFL